MDLKEYVSDTQWYPAGYSLDGWHGQCRTGDGVRNDLPNCKWKNGGDIMEITLDLNECKLRYRVINTGQSVCINVRKLNYRLAFGAEDDCDGARFRLISAMPM